MSLATEESIHIIYSVSVLQTRGKWLFSSWRESIMKRKVFIVFCCRWCQVASCECYCFLNMRRCCSKCCAHFTSLFADSDSGLTWLPWNEAQELKAMIGSLQYEMYKLSVISVRDFECYLAPVCCSRGWRADNCCCMSRESRSVTANRQLTALHCIRGGQSGWDKK